MLQKLTKEVTLGVFLSKNSDICEVVLELTLKTEVHREQCNNDDWDLSRLTGLKALESNKRISRLAQEYVFLALNVENVRLKRP